MDYVINVQLVKNEYAFFYPNLMKMIIIINNNRLKRNKIGFQKTRSLKIKY
jgi:hypothetical protein